MEPIATTTERSEAGPDNEADQVGTLNALGIAYQYEGRFSDAEAAYSRAVQLAESAPEADPLVLAGVFHNLGRLEHARGRAGPGIVWAEGGLALREAIPGATKTDVARDLVALGALYQQAGRLRDAAATFRRAVAILEANDTPNP